MNDRKNFTLKAAIERMDNGVMLVIRQSAAAGSDTIVLKKVYLDPALLVQDLLTALDFPKP